MRLAQRCFKIDRPNAVAMISGYRRNGVSIRQSIWCATSEIDLPALTTYNRAITRFELSHFGQALETDNFGLPFCYAATLDATYYIRNDISLWNTLCTNGLFDIWNPRAPYSRFADSKADSSKYRILLLRLYELNRTFRRDEISHVTTRIDHLLSDGDDVVTVRPLIDDRVFAGTKALLKSSVAPYLTR